MGVSPFIAQLRSLIGHRLLLLPSVAVLPWRPDGRLLLVRLADTGRWATIGGAVEPDESPEEAALRETDEEAGVRVGLSGIRAVLGGPQFRIRYPNGDEIAYVSTVFDAFIESGTPAPDHDETVEVGWFRPGDLADDDISSFTRALLVGARLLAG
ncbi:MAG: NUDIX domain-containing protein [Mycobacterium sp.]